MKIDQVKLIVLIYFGFLFNNCKPAYSQISLPQLVRDSMVLQRDAKVKIWGWASPKEKIQIDFEKKKYKTTADANGDWMIVFSPMTAGGPYTMEISGKNKIVLHDILIGDVWVCAGQSNMEHQMKLHPVNYAGEIASANNAVIRQFKVPNVTNLTSPQNDLRSGYWKWADSNNINDFSAVAYFFAKALYKKYHVPIGIINASWGGVPIESMMSEESLQDFPSILNTVEKNKDTAYVNETNRKAFAAMSSMPHPKDEGMTEKWFDTSYVPKQWRRIAVPGYWEDQGVKDLDGMVWYRREIDVPASITNVAAKVFLGRIVDADELYINGTKIGATGYLYPQRRYAVPDGVLKPGKNLFVVRVTNNFGKGGFVPDKPYELIGGNDTIDLTGYWQYKVGAVNIPLKGFSGFGISLQNQPTALYNSMITPIVKYSYQRFCLVPG